MKRCTIILLLFCAFASAQDRWWNPEWKYRGRIEIMMPPLASGMDTVVFEFGIQRENNTDLSDIRIINRRGEEMPCFVEELMSAGNKTGIVNVYFRENTASETEFWVYYANARATEPGRHWKPSLRGLMLETRKKGSSLHPSNFDEMLGLIAGSHQVFGKGPRHTINDLENPYGPNTDYISMYDGFIACPSDGEYRFSTNSDDASFLLIDGKPVTAWPGAHEKGGGSNAPTVDVWTNSGAAELTCGIHRIQYYMEQGIGEKLSRAAWRKPGDSQFGIIPEEAYLDSIPAKQVSRERLDGKPAAFFVPDVLGDFIINREFPGIALVGFADRSNVGNGFSRKWTIGLVSTGETTPRVALRAGESHPVMLSIADASGTTDTYCRTVFPPVRPDAGRVRIDKNYSLEKQVFHPNEPLSGSIWVRNFSDQGLELVLEKKYPGKTGEFLTEKCSLGPRDTTVFAQKFGQNPEPGIYGFILKYYGLQIGREDLEILHPFRDRRILAIRDGIIRNERGQTVILVTGTRAAIPLRKDGGTCVILNTALPPDKDPSIEFPRRLGKKLTGVSFSTPEIAVPIIILPASEPVCSGYQAICRLSDTVVERAFRVVFCLGMNEILWDLSADDLSRSMNFLIDVLEMRGTRTVFVLPATVKGLERKSKEMREAIRTTAVKRGCGILEYPDI